MINSTSEICIDPNETPTESGEDCSTSDIEIFRATAFDDLLASDATIETFPPQIGECSGLPRATMEVTTSENAGEIETINPTRWTSEQGAVVVVTEEYHPRILE
jgi:hypothetical protein